MNLPAFNPSIITTGEAQIHWAHLGASSVYDDVLNLQRRLRERLLEQTAQGEASAKTIYLLTCSHPPTLTFGYRCNLEAELKMHSREAKHLGVAICKCERGGKATYHGPGFLMFYPVLSLAAWKLSVSEYVRLLLRTMQTVLSEAGLDQALEFLQPEAMPLESTSEKLGPGLWVRPRTTSQPRKLGSVGLHLKEGCTLHGACLNLDGDLDPFRWINPCGHSSDVMTTARLEASRALTQNPEMIELIDERLFDLQFSAARWVEAFSSHLQAQVEGVRRCHRVLPREALQGEPMARV